MLGIVFQYSKPSPKENLDPLPGYESDQALWRKGFPSSPLLTVEEEVVAELQKDDPLSLLYYSGHGTKDGIRLPSGGVLEWRKVLKRVMNSVEAVVVLDCCDFDLPFPFVWRGRRFCINTLGKDAIHTPGTVIILTPSPEIATSKPKGSRVSSLVLPILASGSFEFNQLASTGFRLFSSRAGLQTFHLPID